VDFSTEIHDIRIFSRENDRPIIIRNLTLRLSIDSNEIEIVPNSLKKLVKVPSVVPRDWDIVRNFIKDFEFLHRNLVNFVKDV